MFEYNNSTVFVILFSTQAAEHIAALKSHAFYLLHVHLKQGYDLAAKDANGLSDPYVKFFLRGVNKAAHKSKTVYKDLNPVWDERFVIPVEDPFVPIDIKVGIDIELILILNSHSA